MFWSDEERKGLIGTDIEGLYETYILGLDTQLMIPMPACRSDRKRRCRERLSYKDRSPTSGLSFSSTEPQIKSSSYDGDDDDPADTHSRVGIRIILKSSPRHPATSHWKRTIFKDPVYFHDHLRSRYRERVDPPESHADHRRSLIVEKTSMKTKMMMMKRMKRRR